jgi:hypothetical protein
MRPSIPLLVSAVLAIAPGAQAQSVATPSAPSQAAESQQAAVRPSAAAAPAASAGESKTAHPARRSHKSRALPARVSATSRASAPGDPPGVLALGATDITGNKELPKVMVIVPWKDSLGAGGVIKPTNSLMDDVLQPVDRGVFQRQIRYYGQLDAPAASRVAPVGDSH